MTAFVLVGHSPGGRLAPGARIEVIPGVGHFPQLEAPGHVNDLLEKLL